MRWPNSEPLAEKTVRSGEVSGKKNLPKAQKKTHPQKRKNEAITPSRLRLPYLAAKFKKNKTMKSYFPLLLCIGLLLGFTSCQEEACVAPKLRENIIGIWVGSYSFLNVVETGDLEFKADGTYTDPSGLLLKVGTDPNVYTYTTATNQSNVVISATDGSTSIDSDLIPKSNECDEIVFTFDGAVELTLKRK
jgi:hypothetical protein